MARFKADFLLKLDCNNLTQLKMDAAKHPPDERKIMEGLISDRYDACRKKEEEKKAKDKSRSAKVLPLKEDVTTSAADGDECTPVHAHMADVATGRAPIDSLAQAVVYFHATENGLSVLELGKENGVLGYLPNAVSPRVLNQKAMFTVHCDARIPISVVQSQLGNGSPNLVQLIIPAKLKSNVIEHLDDYGIDGAFLFPGLDGLSARTNRVTASGIERRKQKNKN